MNKQEVRIVYVDEHGFRSKVTFTQTEGDLVTAMQVSAMQPDELIKLMILVSELATQTIQNIATDRSRGDPKKAN